MVNKKIEEGIKSSNGIKDEKLLPLLMKHIVMKKMYCQSWTVLSESDALWRIYSHNQTSIRIAVDTSNINLLDNVEKVEIKYTDNLNEIKKDENNFYQLIGTKREAFAHEKEIRLIKHYKFSSNKDAEEHLTSLLALTRNSDIYYKDIKPENISEEISKLVDKLNYNIQNSTLPVSYAHINNFIDSIMLNPFAPEWFSKTLKLLCEKHDIKYIGKSILYKT